MKAILEMFKFDEIEGYKFKEELSGGKMSNAAIYENEFEEKRVFKFLISPRRKEEFKSFKSEIETLKRINETYPEAKVPKLYTYKIENDDKSEIFYYSMQFLDGRPLNELLENKDELKEEYAIMIISKLAETLSYINSCGYVHRDLHPGNIIISD